MISWLRLFSLIAILSLAFTMACSSDGPKSDHSEATALTADRGEHDRDGGEDAGEHGREGGDENGGERGDGRWEHGEGGGHDEEGEESGTELALGETYDRVRNGARLIIYYDDQSNSFVGTVQNTTEKTLTRVRVEVHLSNGTELGPTQPADLEPGAKREVRLKATERAFNGWTAHPEVGGDKGRGEHGGSKN